MPDDGGWKRYEVVNGELLVTRAPHIRHQGAASKIHVRLENWSEETASGSAFEVPGVVFTEVDAVIPDVVWASNGSRWFVLSIVIAVGAIASIKSLPRIPMARAERCNQYQYPPLCSRKLG